jgi:hypothetical protein
MSSRSKKIRPGNHKLTKLSLQQVNDLVCVRSLLDIWWRQDHHAYTGCQCGGNLEMGSREIVRGSGNAVCSEKDAVVAPSLPKAADEIRYLLTSARVAPVLGLNKEKMRKEVEAARVPSVPEGHINFLGRERIKGVSLRDLNPRD